MTAVRLRVWEMQPFAYVNVFTAHVNVGFFQGAALPDPAGLLQGSGKFMRHVKLRPGTAINDAALSRLIEDAYSDVKARGGTRLGQRNFAGAEDVLSSFFRIQPSA